MTTPNVPDPNDPDAPQETPPPGAAEDGQDRQQPRYGQYSKPEQPSTPPHAGQEDGHADPAGPQGGQYGQAGQYGQPNQYGQGGPYGRPSQYGQMPGQPQYGQGPYGYQAAQPSGYASPAGTGSPRGPAPREVQLGFWLIIAAGVLSFISNLLTSLNLPNLLSAEQTQMLRDSDIDLQDASGFLITFSVLVGLIGLGLYVLIAFFVRRGHNWARIVGTVFAAFSVFGLLVSLPTYFASPLGLLSLVATLTGIAGIVMLYLKPSNPYFQRHDYNPYRPY